MAQLPPEARTLFQLYSPVDLPHALERAEPEVGNELQRSGSFIRTGIKDIDYLVDQCRFFVAARAQAERRGLQGLAALEWAEYLSWPECWRQARIKSRRDLLRRWAFEDRLCRWQHALRARSEQEYPGPPRGPVFWFPPYVQFGPYPSKHRPPALKPASLEGHLSFDPWTKPGPFSPVRRLNFALTWRLQASAFRIYAKSYGGMVEILIDEPRNYSAGEAQAALLANAQRLEEAFPAAEAQDDIPAEVIAQQRHAVQALRAAAAEIGQAGTRARAELLEAFFNVPYTLWLSPVVEVLPDDLPSEWLGVFFGFAFERKGLLSVRERKQLRRVAVAVLETWQTLHFPAHELSHEEAARVTDRLAKIRRLLQAKSLFAYLAKAIQGVETDRPD